MNYSRTVCSTRPCIVSSSNELCEISDSAADSRQLKDCAALDADADIDIRRIYSRSVTSSLRNNLHYLSHGICDVCLCAQCAVQNGSKPPMTEAVLAAMLRLLSYSHCET